MMLSGDLRTLSLMKLRENIKEQAAWYTFTDQVHWISNHLEFAVWDGAESEILYSSSPPSLSCWASKECCFRIILRGSAILYLQKIIKKIKLQMEATPWSYCFHFSVTRTVEPADLLPKCMSHNSQLLFAVALILNYKKIYPPANYSKLHLFLFWSDNSSMKK